MTAIFTSWLTITGWCAVSVLLAFILIELLDRRERRRRRAAIDRELQELKEQERDLLNALYSIGVDEVRRIEVPLHETRRLMRQPARDFGVWERRR